MYIWIFIKPYWLYINEDTKIWNNQNENITLSCINVKEKFENVQKPLNAIFKFSTCYKVQILNLKNVNKVDK